MYRLINSDFTLDYPAPIHPDSVLVGGFAVDRHPASLPPDLEQFVAGSGDAGVIVVSFGTLVRHFGPHWTRLFTAAFARLPQRVVWRHYGNETSADDERFEYDHRLAAFVTKQYTQTQFPSLHIGVGNDPNGRGKGHRAPKVREQIYFRAIM